MNSRISDARNELNYGRRVLSWSFYDWADHAYITTTATTFFPPYYLTIAAPAFLRSSTGVIDEAARALARNTASSVFAFTVSCALFIAAILAPVIGAYADITDQRKRILIRITIAGAVLASSMFFLTAGMWIEALLLYFLTQVLVNVALGLNSSLLPHIAHPEDMNRVSSLGYAMGYVGGGLLLALNTAVFLLSGTFGMSADLAVRTAFLSVGIWWITFMLPLAINVPEPRIQSLNGTRSVTPLRGALVQIRNTFRDIRRYRELFKMLIAFWFYMEGVGAIILLATAYGAALGLDMPVLIGTLLMTQMVAFPYAMMYGRIPDASCRLRSAYLSMVLWTAATLPWVGLYARTKAALSVRNALGMLAADQIAGIIFTLCLGRFLFAGMTKRIDTKHAVLLGLLIYIIVPCWGYYLTTKAEFFMIGWLVGTVQGGTQALSRTIYARLSPPSKSGEFFGFYGFSEKFAGILGPLLYGAVGLITRSPRSSILSIAVFFIIGIILLWRVDMVKGEKVAVEEERAVQEAIGRRASPGDRSRQG
ncbi:MAG TPA: MFS transporter [Nitrospirota bacterium]|nr:MFS transporter [Nitrospirota bacterium]